MNKAINTLMIIFLVLGVMGIVLGITVGLYRNDQLAQIQSGPTAEPDEADIGEADRLTAELLNGNLHTVFLGVGTILTLIGTGMFVLLVRHQAD